MLHSLQAIFSICVLCLLSPGDQAQMKANDGASIFALLFMQGIAGMLFGLFISVQSRSRDQVIQIGIAAVLPTLVLSGTLWPLQSMPALLRSISSILPVTATCQAAKAIHSKATYFPMAAGLLAPCAWSLVFGLLTYLKLQSWIVVQ